MTPEQRRSIANGIWLCRTHAKLIDSDEATYTVEQLHEWKREAEARAKRRLRAASAAALTASRLYGIPRSPSLKFVGRRDETAQLHKLLLHSQAVRIAASVEGLPGIGKTELALQLVFELARDGIFPGGIYWFNAEDPNLLPTWGGVIADALGLEPGPLEERATEALRSVSRQGAATLLVLDNVEVWSRDRRPGPLPEGTHLRHLITTRQRGLGGSAFEHVNVGFLNLQFTRELVEGVAGRKLVDSPGFAELLEYLGGHALASELAGAFLSVYEDETPASYLAELKAYPEIEDEVSELVRYHQTVHRAFETLWDRLDEPTRAAWRLAACFEPEPVTRELSETVGLAPQSRRQLQRLHLIDVNAEGRWWMHRLTRDFRQLTGTKDELVEAQKSFVLGCVQFAEQIELADGFGPYLANRSHLHRALAMAPKVLGAEKPEITALQAGIATGLQSASDYPRAKELLEQALASDVANRGEEHPSVARSRSNLALVLQDLGNLEDARKLLEQALASNLANLGEEHHSVASLRSNLATVLKDLGDLAGARELHELALASAVANLGEEHPSVATLRSNLATVLEKLGDLASARELFEQALASDLANLGEEHPSVATLRSNLAMVLQDLGDFAAARKLLEQALTSDLANLGEEHPKVALRRSCLAMVLKDLGDHEGARELLEQALASNLVNLGEEHPSVATSRSCLAMVLKDLGILVGARELLEQALASDLANLGEGHPTVATRRSNLAVVLQAQGDLNGAIATIRVALQAVKAQPKGSYYRANVERAALQILGSEDESSNGQ